MIILWILTGRACPRGANYQGHVLSKTIRSQRKIKEEIDMYKDIVLCNGCKYFFINPENICMCNNEKGLAFPTGADYCSYAEASDSKREFNNSELLKLVYQQRRNG